MKNLVLSTVLMMGLAMNATPMATNATFNNEVIFETIVDVDVFCKLIQQGDFNAVKTMIEAGADVNKKSVGMTPLMYAARQNKVEILKLLINNGADLKAKSDRGYSALKYAQMSKADDAFKIISEQLKAGKKRKRKS